MYTGLKHLHLTAVVISITLFYLRFFWLMRDSPQMQKKWVRVVPHVNDSILLATAIGMCLQLGQFPFTAPWLTQKFILLLAYIALGIYTLRIASTTVARCTGAGAAAVALVLILGAAFSKQALF